MNKKFKLSLILTGLMALPGLAALPVDRFETLSPEGISRILVDQTRAEGFQVGINILRFSTRVISHEGENIEVRFRGDVSSSDEEALPQTVVRREGGTLVIGLETARRLFLPLIKSGTLELEIRLPESWEGHLDVASPGINVTLEDLSLSRLTGHVRSARLTVRDTRAERMDLSSGSGKIIAERIAGGAVRIESRSGGLRLKDVTGPLEGSVTSGSITAELSGLEAPVVLTARSGRVKVSLPADTEFSLHARSRSGGIRTDFPVTVTRTGDAEPSKGELSGSVGGGGPVLDIKTSSGGIRIEQL